MKLRNVFHYIAADLDEEWMRLDVALLDSACWRAVWL